ncbi:hypothetical protein BC826DRAFT_1106734 [Russula brevipes]|nr:hypothetical protein BC826DRAFT_1106734 [Russula brevipes]
MQRLFSQFSAVDGGQLSPANKPPYATKPWSASYLVALMEVLFMTFTHPLFLGPSMILLGPGSRRFEPMAPILFVGEQPSPNA